MQAGAMSEFEGLPLLGLFDGDSAQQLHRTLIVNSALAQKASS